MADLCCRNCMMILTRPSQTTQVDQLLTPAASDNRQPLGQQAAGQQSVQLCWQEARQTGAFDSPSTDSDPPPADSSPQTQDRGLLPAIEGRLFELSAWEAFKADHRQIWGAIQAALMQDWRVFQARLVKGWRASQAELVRGWRASQAGLAGPSKRGFCKAWGLSQLAC